MLNSIAIMGRLVKDPDLRSTNNGTPVCSFTLAVERDFRQGEEKVTDFFDCVAWTGAAEHIAKYFKKGSMMAVIGNMQSRKWVDKNGNNRLSWEVIVNKTYFAGGRETTSDNNVPGHSVAPQSVFYDEPDDGGELPF